MLSDALDMSVALRCRGLARNGRRPWWNDDRSLGMTFGHGIVNGLAIIRAVCRERRNVGIDLIEQFGKFGNVADIIRRQFGRDDFMRVGINAEVQLAPPPARPDAVFLIEPFALAVNLQAGAVDEKMQWFVAVDPFRQDRQAATATAQSRVIRDGDIDLEHVGDRSQQAFGLTKRLMEYQAKREARLDGDRRIDRLTAPLSGGRRMPCRHSLFGDPYRQASPPDQRRIVFRPIRHPVPSHRDLVAAALVELVRHGVSKRWLSRRLTLLSCRPRHPHVPSPPRPAIATYASCYGTHTTPSLIHAPTRHIIDDLADPQ